MDNFHLSPESPGGILSRLTTYSIWLMPSGKVNDDLSQMISQLGEASATPEFPPHITLLGNLTGSEKELITQLEQLAGRVQPFQVTLTTVGYLDEYFQCLFLKVEETPSLLEANQRARILFHREQNTKFLPHLSLMYGNFDLTVKKQIIGSIQNQFPRQFSVNRLHLYTTSSEPEEWHHVHSSELQGR